MANERSKQNLRPWKKGEPSPNPKGRPKGSRDRATIIREWLNAEESVKNPITGKRQRLSQSDIMTLALVKKARNGDIAAFRELMDGAFGKIPDKQELTGKDGAPMQIEPIDLSGVSTSALAEIMAARDAANKQ